MFEGANEPATLSFHHAPKPISALRGVSESIFQMDNARSADWFKMRGTLTVDLSPQAYRDIQLGEASSDKFDKFFHGFLVAARLVKNAAGKKLLKELNIEVGNGKLNMDAILENHKQLNKEAA